MLYDFLRNETAVISAIVTAVTGLLTGPVFQLDPAAVGSITALVVVVFNSWVRYSVYSKQGAVNVATAVATEAVANVTSKTAGATGVVTPGATAAVSDAVDKVLGVGDERISPPG